MKEKVKNIYKEYISDRRTLLTIVAMTFGFLLTIALSFGTRFFFKDINDSDFWSNFAISFALCVYCLYFGIPEGKELYQKKDNGRYKIARNEFLTIRKEAQLKDNEFNQWLDQYYEKSKKDYYRSILSLQGTVNPQVLDLDLTEIDNLAKPYKKCWKDTEFEGRKDTIFRTHTQEQIDLIKKIYRGEIKVERIPNDFFKTIDGKVVSSEYVEQARDKSKKMKKYAMLIVMRLVLIFLFAIIFASFGIEVAKATSGEQVLNQTVRTVSRIWTMISSFVYGFSIGKVMCMDEASVFEFKYRVNVAFLNDKHFIAMSEEEIAEKEYADYVSSQTEIKEITYVGRKEEVAVGQ